MAIAEAQLYESTAQIAALPEIAKRPHDEGVFVLRAFDRKQRPTTTIEGSIELHGRELDWKLEIPDEPVYDGLAEPISGFGATMETTLPFGGALAQAGYASLVYSPARHDNKSLLERINDPQDLHVDTLVAIDKAARKGLALHQQYSPSDKKIDLDKKLLLPHSMGGFPANKYAELFPERVDLMVQMATCGFGSPTILELLTNIPQGTVPALHHEIGRILTSGKIDINLHNVLGFVYHALGKPSQTISEGLSCLRRNERTRVQRLRDLDIPIGYLAFKHDILVPPNEKTADHVDDYRVMPNAGHAAPQVKPERTVAEVQAMHERLEALRKKPRAVSALG